MFIKAHVLRRPQQVTASSVRRVNGTLLTSLIFAVLVTAGFAFHTSIKNQMNAWKLLPEPERLTELYFTHPNNLPTNYTPGKTQVVSFTVHNLEYQTMTYHYQIVEVSQDNKQVKNLKTSSFTIQSNQYQSVSFTGPLANMGKQAKMVIELPTVHESIDYLITRSDQ